MPRSRILADILRLTGMTGSPGTGLRKIRSLYRKSERQPVLEAMPDSVRVTLPVMGRAVMTEDERSVCSALSRSEPRSTKEISGMLPFGRSKTIDLLKRLVERKIAAAEAAGAGNTGSGERRSSDFCVTMKIQKLFLREIPVMFLHIRKDRQGMNIRRAGGIR